MYFKTLSVFILKKYLGSLLSVGHLLGEEGVGLVDSHVQEVVALQNTLDFIDAQINPIAVILEAFPPLRCCTKSLILVPTCCLSMGFS